MTLKEYLADGYALPTIFSQIVGFVNLFTFVYTDDELAFDAPTFQRKIDVYASDIIPVYKDKLTKIEAYKNALETTEKETADISTANISNGAQRVENIELPIDDATAEPSSVTKSDGVQNEERRTNIHTEKGTDVNGVLAKLAYYEKKEEVTRLKCAEEFKYFFVNAWGF